MFSVAGFDEVEHDGITLQLWGWLTRFLQVGVEMAMAMNSWRDQWFWGITKSDSIGFAVLSLGLI